MGQEGLGIRRVVIAVFCCLICYSILFIVSSVRHPFSSGLLQTDGALFSSEQFRLEPSSFEKKDQNQNIQSESLATDGLATNSIIQDDSHHQVTTHGNKNVSETGQQGHILEVTSSPISRVNQSSTNFKRYDGVAIVTKVLWDKDVSTVCEMLCYIAHAYNDDMRYDIVVFTTIPWSEENIAKVQNIAAPAKVTVAVEGPSLEEQLAALSKEELTMLRNRCFLKDKPNETLTWQHYCGEEGSKDVVNLGYCWQAEFRAYHIWTHEALKPYKYMIWVDSDCRIGKKWDQDPMAVMIENDLTLLYSGWPYGKFKDVKTKDKMQQIYNMTICYSKQNSEGELYGKMCKSGTNMPYLIRQVAGNHHITNLDHYRKDIHQNFLKLFVGDYKFSRKFDDQIAVTIVGLMEQELRQEGLKVWHERSKNLTLKIAHHRMFDVQHSERAPARRLDFFEAVKGQWAGLEERCGALFQ
mmetsp:Transcript_15728/g.29671  ORF Transcript_15728/g.29671 Transcript_15728/m.29671 type:complete len:467 (-) Transcript_15728:3473-4873(-)